jgi:hypothetical protein
MHRMEQIFQCSSGEYFSKVDAGFDVISSATDDRFTVSKGWFRSVEIIMIPAGDELLVQYKPTITKLGLLLSVIISLIIASNILFIAVTFIALFFIQIAYSSQLTWEILQATQTTIKLREN